MRKPKCVNKFMEPPYESVAMSRELTLSPQCKSFWGSAEEFEVQSVLQDIVTSSLDSQQTTNILVALRNKLEFSPTGWADRFVVCQGMSVLYKLLSDINLGRHESESRADREYIIIQCFSLLYSKSMIAQQLITEDPKEQLMKSLLKSLLSPREETRILVSRTLMDLKSTTGSPSRVLHTLTLSRNACKKKQGRS